ncbi:MAG: class I adenylate-forming enzyme family protein [Pseudomonadota bacterium]
MNAGTGRVDEQVAGGHAVDQPTVYELFRRQATATPDALALRTATRDLHYGALLDRVELAVRQLRERSVGRGDRIAVLAENRPEYTILQLAAAKLGAIVACMNWRLAAAELQACLDAVEPRLLAVSARYAAAAASLSLDGCARVDVESLCPEHGSPDLEPATAAPDDGLLIIFTSGTTGTPRAAVISQRAEIARMGVLRRDLHIEPDDAFVAWSPMFHMGGSEHTLASLMFGAPVVVCDGLEVERIAEAIGSLRIGWLLLVPATLEPLLDELRRRRASVVGVKVVGCMADLVPAASIEAITTELRAPFLNSFGSTETGLPPLSGHLLAVGESLADLAKQPNSGCELRLVDGSGRDVADGEVGEAWVRGPTLFSGYWTRRALDRASFRDGWYAMGDLFRRTPGNRYQFVGRSKYLIKSGGENIYPAEIERVLLDDERIEDAVVVRRADPVWGEVPVAFVVRRTQELQEEHVMDLCLRRLARYKRPKEVRFLAAADLPRNATGKIVRELLEKIA